MFAGKHDNFITKLFSLPGLLMQRITTREPDDSQIEVAIIALKSALPEEFPDFVHIDTHEIKAGDEEKSEDLSEATISEENNA